MEWNFFRLYLKKNSLEIQYNIPLSLIVGNFQSIIPFAPPPFSIINVQNKTY